MDVSKRRHNGNIHKQCSPRQDTTPFGAQPGSTSFAHEINIDTQTMQSQIRRHTMRRTGRIYIVHNADMDT